MSTTPSMSIEAGPPTSQADIDQMIERVRAEHPDVKITVNPGPEDALRDATRRYAPEVAEALDAGEVELAAQRLLVRLARLSQ